MESFLKSLTTRKMVFAWAFLFVFFVAAFSIDYYRDNKLLVNEECQSDYSFINPEPDCEIYEKKLENFSKLQGKLEAKVEVWEAVPGVERVAVFSRDLLTRRFVGVHENDSFYMASLLKVPVMIAWYKLAEVEPRILDTKITYAGTPNLYDEQKVVPEKKLIVGKTYTIRDLIDAAIIYSDNTAAEILLSNLPSEFIDRILSRLSLQFNRPEGLKENIITAKSYAGIFRVLYNSSFLTREYSNKSLETLSKVAYQEGAVKLLTKDTIVSHKFGERETKTPDGRIVVQLHDCGIVYAKNGTEPYTFCIMTEGTNFDSQQKVVQEISKLIYENI